MKTSPNIDLLHSLSQNPRIGGMMFLSIGLHMIAISAMFFLPNLSSTRTFYSPIYSVRLVNVPPSFGPLGAEVPQPSSQALPSKSTPAEEKLKARAKEKPVSLPPAIKEDPGKKITEAIERVRERQEKERVDTAIERIRSEKESSQLSSAIEGIRRKKEARQPSSPIERTRREKEVRQPSSTIDTRREKEASQVSLATESLRKETRQLSSAIERTRREKEPSQVSSAIEGLRKEAHQLSSSIEGLRRLVIIGSEGAVETGEEGTGGASSAVMSVKFKIYYNLLWQRIHDVWVLPEEVLGGKKNLETIIAIRIAQDGQIEDIQFEKKSGNPYLDESALRAIKKANPLPPLPAGVGTDKFDVGVRFTPSDL